MTKMKYNRCWYRYMPRITHKDNPGRLYNHKLVWDGVQKIYTSFEDFLKNAVKDARQRWIANPFCFDVNGNIMYNEDGSFLPDDTVWERLNLSDSQFSKNHQYYYRVRAPKLTANNKEWENFYVTFPWIAKEVITGKERYSSGAKLKWIPLFDKILEKEWPKEERYKISKKEIEIALEHIKADKAERELYNDEYRFPVFRKKAKKKIRTAIQKW